MKTANMTRHKSQVYSVGNYLMTGKVLGKGHFARVEEATHRIIGKKVAIKIIDLTCIKEEYARRNLHREPRVMAKLRHPCIAALYETMMHGPRLYVVMEAAGGGDLCAHVLGARARGHDLARSSAASGHATGHVPGHVPGHVAGHAAGHVRGLPEHAARALAAQLVSAVKHMHARGVVHRDLKMENIMLDSTKQFIKIVDFGLSNTWSAGGALRTPCGSLEYAAPELFVDGRRYGPEVDLWSIGVIVYGMVTGGLPFSGGEDSASRARLRAAISRGLTRTQRAALAALSTECKSFIQQLLEPNVETRMKIDEAARHRWVKRQGMRMKTHPLGCVETKVNREIFRQISELCGQNIIDVVAQIKADPFGATAGIYNIKTHLHQIQPVPGVDLLWSNCVQEPRPASPPEYHAKYELECPIPSSSKAPPNLKLKVTNTPPVLTRPAQTVAAKKVNREMKPPVKLELDRPKPRPSDSQSFPTPNRPMSSFIKKTYKVYDSGDCGLDRRLPSINEHSNTDVNDKKARSKMVKAPCVRKVSLEDERPARLNSCPNKIGDKRPEFYRRAGDGIPSWRASGVTNTPPTRILLQNHATTIKRASLGNILSPHSSSNSQCKSERAMPVGWFSSRSVNKEPSSHMQRLRRTVPMK